MVEGFRFFCCCWIFLLEAAPINLAADLGGVDFLAAGWALAGFSLAGAIRPDWPLLFAAFQQSRSRLNLAGFPVSGFFFERLSRFQQNC